MLFHLRASEDLLVLRTTAMTITVVPRGVVASFRRLHKTMHKSVQPASGSADGRVGQFADSVGLIVVAVLGIVRVH